MTESEGDVLLGIGIYIGRGNRGSRGKISVRSCDRIFVYLCTFKFITVMLPFGNWFWYGKRNKLRILCGME